MKYTFQYEENTENKKDDTVTENFEIPDEKSVEIN